jgi:hypothetical protein
VAIGLRRGCYKSLSCCSDRGVKDRSHLGDRGDFWLVGLLRSLSRSDLIVFRKKKISNQFGSAGLSRERKDWSILFGTRSSVSVNWWTLVLAAASDGEKKNLNEMASRFTTEGVGPRAIASPAIGSRAWDQCPLRALFLGPVLLSVPFFSDRY